MLYRLSPLLILLLLLGCTENEDMLKVRRDIGDIKSQLYEIEKQQAELKQELLAKARDMDRKLEQKPKIDDVAQSREVIRDLERRLDQSEALIADLEARITQIQRAATDVPLNTGAPVTQTPTEGTEQTGETVVDGTDQATDAATGEDVTASASTVDTGGETIVVQGNQIEQQFNQALLDYNRGKYDVAMVGFSDLLTNFPTSPFAEPSYYYLGVCNFQNKNYEDARTNFATITQKYPNGDFVRQSKLYLGQCFFYLNQHTRAILALRDLIDNYPGTQEADLAKRFLKKTGYER